jgi:thiamine-monophosphate kinase
MIDVSDGLSKDLARLCAASGVGADVLTGTLPIDPGLFDLRAVTGDDPMALAVSGGEDFELLAAMPAEAVAEAAATLAERFGTPLTEIGLVRGGEGLTAVGPDGSRAAMAEDGWDHFAR